MAEKSFTVPRAYTLRLHGLDESDQSWRGGPWATHEAVNKRVKVSGDWLMAATEVCRG